ncbi:MAG: hypothetical protein HRU76_13480 [Phycisphaeraceae bacterium]|nr:hypothetical protein [Phycisphaerales bacterium]QOJ18536.1 MAG: hypothetical protein HRU76_13480 [Phycisphaeraceae bacterium]
MTTPTTELTIERRITFASPRRQRPSRHDSDATRSTPVGRTPRVARLLALAYRIDDLVQRGDVGGHVGGYAAVANVGGVTRARVSQITALLNLAPDIQEAVLALPGDTAISEHDLRPIAAEIDWRTQRRMWKALSHRNP